jgi:hypothetical protein
MHSERFTEPSLDTLERPRPAGKAPQLGLPSPPLSPDLPPGTNRSILIATGDETPIRPSSVRSSAPQRRGTAAELSDGSLLYLVLVGLIATATVGVFFGAGFSLMTHPVKESVTDSGAAGSNPPRPYGDRARPDRESPPTPRGLTVPDSAAEAALPVPPLAQPAAVIEAATAQQDKAAQGSPPAPPSGQPPAQTTPEPEPASSSATSPAPPTSLASPMRVSEMDGGFPAGAKRPPTRSDRARAVSRQSHTRSGRTARSRTPSQSSSAQQLTPPKTEQTGSFDQLLSQLAGQTKPAARR